MSETKNKYAEYFYDGVPAIQKISEDSMKVISDSAEEFLASTNSSLKKNENTFRPRSRFDVIDPGTLVYSDRIVQNSEIMDSRSRLNAEQMARNVKNSTGKKPVVKTSTKKKNANLWNKLSKTGKEVVLVMVVGSIMLTGYVAAKGIDATKDKVNATVYTQQEYGDVFSSNVIHYYENTENGVTPYDYDIEGMGRDIAAAEDPEIALYAVYSGANYLKYDVTHGAFAAAKEVNPDVFGESKTFKEYAAALGCVDKDDKIDYERYEEITEARLLAKQTLAENSVSEVSVK